MNRVQKAAAERDRIKQQAPQLADLIGKMSRAKAEGKDPYSVSVPPHLRPKPAGPTSGATRSIRGSGRPKSQPENKVKNDCLRWLKDRGIYAWRNNTGMVWAGNHPIRFGLVGSADIIGLLPDGRFLGIECKSKTGKQSDVQKRFQENIEQNHGVYVLAYDVTDLEEALHDVIAVA